MILEQDIPTLKDSGQMTTVNDDVLYSSRKDEDIPEVTQVQLNEPDEIGIKIREPIIKNDTAEINSPVVDLGTETVNVNEQTNSVKTEGVKAVSVTKGFFNKFFDRLTLTIYQLIK